MAIQNRRGADADFDSHKMLPGELAVTTDGSRKVYATFAPGDSREVAFKDQIPIIGNVTPAEVQTAVDNYLTENPVQAGATKEQAKQIELNRQNIELNKEEIDKANANIAQIANPNLFINGNFQIWSNGESFEVYGTNNEGTTTVICDKWYAKHYDLENNYYITKAGAQGIRLFSASEEPCYIYQILDEETFNALQGKTVTLSWSYTQSYGDANHVEYETIKKSEQIIVGTDLDVFTAMTKIGFTNGIAGCIVHWIKLEVGELKTPCVPDSKDAIICKLENSSVMTSDEVKTMDTLFGKPVYTKSYRFTDSIQADTVFDYPHGVTDAEYIWVDLQNSFFVSTTNGLFCTTAVGTRYYSQPSFLQINVNQNSIICDSDGGWNYGWIKVITLRYTKTTDKYL